MFFCCSLSHNTNAGTDMLSIAGRRPAKKQTKRIPPKKSLRLLKTLLLVPYMAKSSQDQGKLSQAKPSHLQAIEAGVETDRRTWRSEHRAALANVLATNRVELSLSLVERALTLLTVPRKGMIKR